MKHPVIDTHAHLYLPDFQEDRDDVMRRARDEGVERIYLPNIDSTTITDLQALTQAYPDLCVPMMGLHPCSVNDHFREELNHIHDELMSGTYAAVGEIGTDLYWDQTFRDQQELCFTTQLGWAKELELPAVIHSRDSLDWNIELVTKHADASLRGIFHCFTGTVEQAHRIHELGFLLGIGGVVTFRNSGLDAVVAQLPLEFLVLETDAPYLTPHPHRGKRNESGYISLVAEKIAAVQGRSVEEVRDVTTANARRVFGKAL